MGYEYWRTEVVDRFSPSTVSDAGPETMRAYQPEMDEEAQLQEAMRVSREAFYGITSPSPPSSSSPPKRRRRQITPSNTDESDTDSLYAQPCLVVKPRASPKRSRPSRLGDNPFTPRSEPSNEGQQPHQPKGNTMFGSSHPQTQQSVGAGRRSSFLGGTSILDQIGRLGRCSKAPTKDDIEEDL
jgi:hypothetical protein